MTGEDVLRNDTTDESARSRPLYESSSKQLRLVASHHRFSGSFRLKSPRIHRSTDQGVPQRNRPILPSHLTAPINPPARPDVHDSDGGAKPTAWAWNDSTVHARHDRFPPYICDSTVAIDSGRAIRGRDFCPSEIAVSVFDDNPVGWTPRPSEA